MATRRKKTEPEMSNSAELEAAADKFLEEAEKKEKESANAFDNSDDSEGKPKMSEEDEKLFNDTLEKLLVMAKSKKSVIEDTEIIDAFKDKQEFLTDDNMTRVIDFFERNKVDVLTITEDDDDVEEYRIVGSKEADPSNNKISNESPLAKGIMGARVGDKCTVESPNGNYQVEVLEIK